MKEEILTLLTYFIIYSFLGWVLESTFRSILEKKLINTGFLIGPLCPIYGFGACIMFLFLQGLSNNIVLLFIVSFVLLTLWEYVVGVLLEKMFHTKYWDYSNHKINFQGRICLTNSIYWGVLGVVFIKIIHPLVQSGIQKVDSHLLHIIVIIATIAFLTDMIVTIIRVKNIKVNLEKIEKLNQEIKEKLKEAKLKDENFSGEHIKADVTENMQKLIENLKKRRNKIILKLYKNVYRLKRAFPAIETREIKEILNKKVEIKKIKDLKRKGKIKKGPKLLEK